MRQLNFVVWGLLVGVLFSLTSCEQEWKVSVEPGPPAGPIICFFHRFSCRPDDGVQMDSVSIYEIGSTGSTGQEYWSIYYDFKTANAPGYKGTEILRKVTYGIVPKGWAAGENSIPLQTGRYYVINHRWVFHRVKDGTYSTETLQHFLENEKK